MSGTSARVNRLVIENFLSLAKVTINLGDLTVLVGPNAGGKSNIVKVLAFLSTYGISRQAMLLRGMFQKLGYTNIKQVFYDLTRPVRIAAQFQGKGGRKEFSIAFDSNMKIVEERITCEGDVVLQRTRGRLQYKQSVGGMKSQSINEMQPALGVLQEDPGPEVTDMKDILGRIHVYSFVPEKMRARNEILFNRILNSDGSNMVQVLHTLLTSDRSAFIEIEETVKTLIPEIDQINVLPEESGKFAYLTIQEEGILKPLEPENISDGTLRLMAFVLALNLRGVLIAFEEPENCVHPRLLQTIIDMSRKAQCQIIMATQSPYLVSKIRHMELLVVRKEDGRTVVSPCPAH